MENSNSSRGLLGRRGLLAFYDDEKALLHSRSERERKKRLIYLYIRQQSVAVFRFFRRRKAIGETSTIISIGVRTCKDLRATESARALPPSTSSYVHQRPSSSSSRSPPSLSFFLLATSNSRQKKMGPGPKSSSSSGPFCSCHSVQCGATSFPFFFSSPSSKRHPSPPPSPPSNLLLLLLRVCVGHLPLPVAK